MTIVETKKSKAIILIALIFVVLSLFICITSAADGTKTVTDMAGNTVTVPDTVNKVITLNGIPILNSYVIALGKGDTIMNSLPAGGQSATKYQTIIVPQLANGVDLGKGKVNAEQIMTLNPDVVITSEKSTIESLNKTNIPVIYIPSMGDIGTTKKSMNILGQVFNEESRAQEYNKYADELSANLKSKLGSIPDNQKQKVLYMWATSLAVFNSSGWVVPAGGVDAFDGSHIKGGFGGVNVRYEGNIEEIQKWNPDVIVVKDASDIPYLKENAQFSEINAVKNNKIYVCPAGLATWTSDTELPLLPEWAATKLHPDEVSESDLIKDTQNLYKKFFGYDLSDEQAKGIINGTP